MLPVGDLHQTAARIMASHIPVSVGLRSKDYLQDQVIDGLVTSDENKIHKTDDLVESSTTKINKAIYELNKVMVDGDFVNFTGK